MLDPNRRVKSYDAGYSRKTNVGFPLWHPFSSCPPNKVYSKSCYGYLIYLAWPVKCTFLTWVQRSIRSWHPLFVQVPCLILFFWNFTGAAVLVGVAIVLIVSALLVMHQYHQTRQSLLKLNCIALVRTMNMIWCREIAVPTGEEQNSMDERIGVHNSGPMTEHDLPRANTMLSSCDLRAIASPHTKFNNWSYLVFWFSRAIIKLVVKRPWRQTNYTMNIPNFIGIFATCLGAWS